MRRLYRRRILLQVVMIGFFACAIQGERLAQSSEVAEQLIQSARKAEQEKDYFAAAAAYERLCALRPKDPWAHQSLGIARYLQGNYAGAVSPLERALELNSQLSGSRLYLGICYYRTNQFEKAVACLKLAQQAKPKEPMAIYWLGASHLALRNFAEATARLEGAKRLAPGDPEILYTLAKAYADYSGSLFEGLLQTSPQSDAARLLRAEDYWRENLTQPALELLLEAGQAQSDMPGLHLTAGEILWQEGKFEEACEEFQKELSVDPGAPRAHRRLATYYQKVDQPARAKPHFDYLARLKPLDQVSDEFRNPTNSTGAPGTRSTVASGPASGDLLKRARACYANGETAQAIEYLRLHIKALPRDVGGHRLMARCWLVNEQFLPSAATLQAILRIRPEDAEAKFLLAKTYEALASQVVQQMVVLEPDSYRVRILRGAAHEKSVRREYVEALNEYLEALKLKPATPGISFAAGRILWKMNRFDEAVPYLQNELALNPHHGLAHYYLGSIFLSRSDNQRALDHLDKALQAQPGLIQAHRDRGRVLASLKRYDEAIDAFQQVVAANPEDSSIHVLMATSYRAMGRLEDAKRSGLVAQELSERRRRMPGK